jgi:hypothetical protein
MKKALLEETSPLDACLETVLPGVHQWHQANNQAVVRLVDRVDVFGEAVAGGINTLITKMDRLEQQRAEQDSRIAQLFELGAHAFRNGQSPNRPTASSFATAFENMQLGGPADAPVPPGDTSPTQPVTVSQEDDELQIHASYRMRPKHRYLTELYDEWMGVGDGDNYGGIQGRNEKYGARWRKHIPSQIYSRTARTVEALRIYAKTRHGGDVYAACRELQTEFEACKYSVANMVNYFIGISILDKKKPRGKMNNQ